MAPLTWRNIEAPGFGGVSEANRASAAMMQQGLAALTEVLGDLKKTRDERQLLADYRAMMPLTRAEEFEAAIRSGALSPLTNEGARAMLSRRGELLIDRNRELTNTGQELTNVGIGLSNTGKRLSNTGLGLLNEHRAFTNQRERAEYERLLAERAARPALVNTLLEVQSMAETGDPEKIAAAQQMMRSNPDVFLAAGVEPARILEQYRDIRPQGVAGDAYKQTLRGWGLRDLQQRAEDSGRQIAEETLAAYPDDPVYALDQVLGSNLPQRVKNEAAREIQNLTKDGFITPVDATDEYLAQIQGGGQPAGTAATIPSVTPLLADRASAGSTASGDPAPTQADLIDAVIRERAGDTLGQPVVPGSVSMSTLRGKQVIQDAFDPDRNLASYLTDRPNRGVGSAMEMANILASTSLKGENLGVDKIAGAIQELIDYTDGRLAPDVAGRIIEENAVRSGKGWTGPYWEPGIDMDRAKKRVEQLFKKDKSGKFSPRIDILTNAESARNYERELATLDQHYQATLARLRQINGLIRRHGETPELRKDREKEMRKLEQLGAQMTDIGINRFRPDNLSALTTLPR